MTLIEILLFTGIIAMLSTITLPLLFSVAETRIRQQNQMLVEQNGALLLQTVTRYARESERVLAPEAGEGEGSTFLALQTAAEASDPTILALSGGSIMAIRHNARQIISSPQVTVKDFLVRNTSVSDSRQSLLVSFTVERTAWIGREAIYTRPFQLSIALFPDDVPDGNACQCTAPVCDTDVDGNPVLSWSVCDTGVCTGPFTSKAQCE